MEITHNNKTYRWIGDKWGAYDLELYRMLIAKDGRNNDLVWLKENLEEYAGSICTFHTIPQLVKLGYLEEVKENKELMEDETLEAIKEFEEYKKSVDDSSILEKLREEIKCTIAWYDNAWHEPDRTVREVCRQFLTSLEQSQTKEENTVLVSNARTMQEQEQPQFTPGQMIEVSNDGEKWEEEKYTFMRMKGNYYECTNGSTWYVWKYARPLTEEVIVPEFDYDKIHMEAMEHGVTFAVHVAHLLCKQVELLTNAVNKLIKANKKPL